MISSSPTRRGINIFAAEGSPVVAVNDGVIVRSGNSTTLGKLRRPPGRLRQPLHLRRARQDRPQAPHGGDADRQGEAGPGRQREHPPAPLRAAGPGRQRASRDEAGESVDSAAAKGADGTLKVGSKVIAGTVLARIGGGADGIDPHINFSIRPAGSGAPRIDPKPILDGWKLLEATAIYRAKGKNPLTADLSGAGVLLLSKEALQRRVLADEDLDIYECGRDRHRHRPDRPPRPGDARVPGLEGLQPDDHLAAVRPQLLTTSGYVSEHTTGDAVDIAMINGVPVTGHQGPGTLPTS